MRLLCRMCYRWTADDAVVACRRLPGFRLPIRHTVFSLVAGPAWTAVPRSNDRRDGLDSFMLPLFIATCLISGCVINTQVSGILFYDSALPIYVSKNDLLTEVTA